MDEFQFLYEESRICDQIPTTPYSATWEDEKSLDHRIQGFRNATTGTVVTTIPCVNNHLLRVPDHSVIGAPILTDSGFSMTTSSCQQNITSINNKCLEHVPVRASRLPHSQGYQTSMTDLFHMNNTSLFQHNLSEEFTDIGKPQCGTATREPILIQPNKPPEVRESVSCPAQKRQNFVRSFEPTPWTSSAPEFCVSSLDDGIDFRKLEIENESVEERQSCDTETFHCDWCKGIFSSKCELLEHILRDCDNSEHECHQCKKKFSTKKRLIRHLMSQNHSGFICKFCQKRFRAKLHLNYHVVIHTGEKPYQCEFCQKRFNVKCNLLTHLRFHSGEKPFVCTFCQERFYEKSALEMHVLIHVGEKPYQCEFCEKSFNHQCSLKRHCLQIHHSGK